MLWPLILPMQLTAVLVLIAAIAYARYATRSLKLQPPKAVGLSVLVAVLAFVPSCTGVMWVLDGLRFGVFRYETYEGVNDHRIERYLPPAARDITLEKTAGGHRARYHIAEAELRAYVDDLWRQHAPYSRVQRSEIDGDGQVVSTRTFARQFKGLGWTLPSAALQLESPKRSNWAGCSYYYDLEANVAYHDAGYW